MRNLEDLRNTMPSVRVGSTEEGESPDFVRLYRSVTGKDPVVQHRRLQNGLPVEQIHTAYYVEFSTEQEMERFLALWPLSPEADLINKAPIGSAS